MVKKINIGGAEVEAEKFSDGSAANVNKQEEILAKKAAEDRQTRIATATEAFNAYHKLYSQDHNLDPAETVSALFLENLNFREFYPKELGGIPEYDRITQEVFNWFEENKHK